MGKFNRQQIDNIFPRKQAWHFMQIVSLVGLALVGDNLHEISKPFFWEK